MEHDHDVTVLGGGLAGLTLALQIRQRRPETRIAVVERRRHPVPDAAHKVGESSVEIGAHYFSHVLGLREHIDQRQLPKYGLRFYFRSYPGQPIQEGLEVGPSRWPRTPSYQLDRGVLENHLGERLRAEGVTFLDDARVVDVELGRGRAPHRVRLSRDGEEVEVTTRWAVDASGRAAVLKRRLGLAEEVGHRASAAWFRIGTKVDVDEFCDDPAWREQGRTEGPRHLSTNHLMGRGYWVWLIPLSSGSTSIGIVADDDLHPLRGFNSFDKALGWLRRNEPECAAAVERAVGGGAPVQDFLAVKRYPHGARRVFGERWALVGDAGVFLDPFYSPGSDFIAMANTYVSDLVCRDLAGERVRERAAFYEQLFLSFFRNGLSVYEGLYPVWGNGRVMPVKVAWDYFFYWAVICALFFNQKLTDLGAVVAVRRDLDAAVVLNRRMQAFFGAWDGVDRGPVPAGFFDHSSHDALIRLNDELHERVDGEAFVARVRANVALLEEVAAEIVARASAGSPGLADVWEDVPSRPATDHMAAAFATLGMDGRDESSAVGAEAPRG